jgi:hypothetical protein
MTRLALGLLVVALAAAGIVAVNVLLLGRASSANDPIGRLVARTHLPAAPGWTVRPVRGEVENDGADD